MNSASSAQALSDFIGFLSPLRLTSAQAAEANRQRDHLLRRLQDLGVQQSFYGSKLYTGELSPGCATCGAGSWSCVYLTRQCTADCFFCPSDPRLDSRLPRANRMPLSGLDSYLDLLRLVGFRGVSFSGGETLLCVEEMVTWIARIRQEFGTGVYIWIYSNGDLLDQATLETLHQAGLDEIRINIRARNYGLGPVALARNYVRTVTVEIPTIPEEYEILKTRIVDLHRLGVDHLNLHQLFANSANHRSLSGRSYTFLTPVGSATPVLESELVALRLLVYTLENDIDLPINYCSLVYRTRRDELAHRRRAACLARTAQESLTGTGFVRRLSVTGPAERIQQIEVALRGEGYDPSLWRVTDGGSRLLVHPHLLASPEVQREMIDVRHLQAEMRSDSMDWMGLYEPVAELQPGPDLRLWIGERLVSTPVSLPGAQVGAWLAAGGGASLPGPQPAASGPSWAPIHAAEQMARGLQRIEPVDSLLETLAT